MSHRGGDDGSDDTGGDGGHDVVAVDLAPLIAARRRAEVIGAPVVHALGATPVVGAHVVALSPVVVADVTLMIGVVIVIALRDGRERCAAKTEEDE